MPWVYQQASGRLFLNTIFIGAGYSGHGGGLNDPAAQDQQNVGPIPAGSYAIGPAHRPIDHLGPMALPLYPDPANEMFGRFGFFVHGDNQFANDSASDGCIIIAPDIRRQISTSGESTLLVVSGLEPRPPAGRLTVDPLQRALIERLSADARVALTGRVSRDRTSADRVFAAAPTLEETIDALLRELAPVNAYTDLPVLPFQRTSVTMPEVVAAFGASDQPIEVRRASYVMFRNESANGAKGINNNYCGAQADGGRWPESFTPSFSGTVTMRENGTQRLRIFLAFKAMPGNLDFLMNRALNRGLYIGGQTHLVLTMNVNSAEDLARAYHKEWVTGSEDSEPSAEETASFLSMYRQAVELIT